MPLRTSGENANFKMAEWSGPQGRNNVELVAGVSGLKIAIDDILFSNGGTATRVRFNFRTTAGVNKKIHEFILGANINFHVPFAGAPISAAGDSLVMDVEEEEIHILVIYETTT